MRAVRWLLAPVLWPLAVAAVVAMLAAAAVLAGVHAVYGGHE